VLRAGREAVALLRTDLPGGSGLAAYVVTESPEAVRPLRGWLEERLPAYMVPAAFVRLQSLPRTPNGKLDRRALEQIAPEMEPRADGFVAPRTPLEERLAVLFSELLGVREMGIRESFFALGGHSLLAAQLLARIRAELGVEVPLKRIFQRATVESLAGEVALLLQAGGRADDEIPRLPEAGSYLLSFAQQRLWLVDQMEAASPFYNIAVAFRLVGPLRVDLLRCAADEILRRHENLRTTFTSVDGEPRQVIQPPRAAELPLIDLTGVAGREQIAERLVQEEVHGSFDLSRGPLSRGRLVRLAEQEHVLLWMVHHIVADWWSLDVLVRELTVLYSALSRGAASPLPELPVQYRHFAVWQRQRLQGETLAELRSYWLRRLAGAPSLLCLATDRSRPARQSFRGARRATGFPPELGRRVAVLADREGCTVFMTLLGAFAVFLRRSSGQEDLLVGAPFGARQRAELEGLTGLFVNALPLRLDLSGDPTFRELLDRVRQRVVEALVHQQMPFEKLVEELQPERDPGYNPLFQVTFNLIEGDMAQPLAMPGLEVVPFPFAGESTQFDLSLTVFRRGQDLTATFQYSTDLFDALTIAWMGEDLRQVLDRVAAEPEIPLSRLDEVLVAAEEERRAALAEELRRAHRESFGLRRRQSVTVLEGA
jgi:hypothetical protein